jgi:LemA protein
LPLAFAAMFVAVILVVLVAFLIVTTYNNVVALQRRIDRAWANVDVALQQRWDQLPNLVAAVRGVMGFEQAVLQEVTRLRAAYTPAAPVAQQAALALATSAAVGNLLATVEAYPELRSQENVLALQEETERLETVIAGRRELFNEQVFRYNATIEQVPAVLLADLFRWRPREYFECGPRERTRPEATIFAS